jgi:hypothetical protein
MFYYTGPRQLKVKQTVSYLLLDHSHKNFFTIKWVILGTHLGACIKKYITAVIYGFSNKLEFLSLITRLGWKGLPGTNTLAYYGNRKLRLYLVL